MSRDVYKAIFFWISLALLALNPGCGGGGMPPNNSNQSLAADGQTAKKMQAPTLGFAYAPGSIEARVIYGIPGASVLGSALVVPEGATSLDFAPGQRAAIVGRGSGAPVGVMSFSGATPGALVPIPGGISQPDIVAFSPKGAAAALYSEANGQVQVVAGLPNNPQLVRSLETLPAPAQFLAMADDGVTLLEGTAAGEVYLLASGGPQLLESVSSLGGMAFNPKSTDALIFNRADGALELRPSVASGSPSRPLASGLTGLEGSIALASDGRHAVITSTGANQLWEVDLGSLQTQSLTLAAPPTMLKGLSVSGDYLLAWQPGGLAWIIDTTQTKGTVYMVPMAAPTRAALER